MGTIGESAGRALDGEFVEFFAAGQAAVGEFRCSTCGYGVIVHRALPVCPMCGGGDWEQSSWSPFSRAGDDLPLQ